MTDVVAALRPFLWLAAIAFLVGFASYLVLARPGELVTQAQADGWSARVSAPVSDEWNTPKHI